MWKFLKTSLFIVLPHVLNLCRVWPHMLRYTFPKIIENVFGKWVGVTAEHIIVVVPHVVLHDGGEPRVQFTDEVVVGIHVFS